MSDPTQEPARLEGLLIRLRQRAMLSQEQLAHRAGLTARTLRRWESGASRPRGESLRLLADALGLSPDQSAALAAAAHGPADAGPLEDVPAGAVPRQLPPDVRGFAGRAEHVRELDALMPLAAKCAGVAAAIVGTAGVGKTALAVRWARTAADHFPDGQLYVNLRGFDPATRAVRPGEAVRAFLDALGVLPRQIPVTLAAQVALYRSLLSDRQMLVVLDNARDAEHVRGLLPAAIGCLAIVTSRDRLTGLVAVDGVHPLMLDLLDLEEAYALLAHRLGGARLANEPAATSAIIDLCARLPLALAVAAATAATQPQLTLTALAGKLRDAAGQQEIFDGEDLVTNVHAAFWCSYRTLSAPAARLFRLLGLHSGPEISINAAARLAGISEAGAQAQLTELVRAQLIAETQSGRYGCHDLLHAYAGRLVTEQETDLARRAAVRRSLDYYLHTTAAADRLLQPYRWPLTLDPPVPGAEPEVFSELAQAMRWLTDERLTLLAMVGQAAEHGFNTRTWQLAWSLADFLDRRGDWHDLLACQATALSAAEDQRDRAGRARAHQNLAFAHARLGRLGHAHSHYRRAIALYEQLGDHVHQGRCHFDCVDLLNRRGRPGAALAHARRALALYRIAGHGVAAAYALDCIGYCLTKLGDHRNALAACDQALAAFEAADDRYGQATTWNSLGIIHHALGDHGAAVAAYQNTLSLLQGSLDRYNTALTLSRLAQAHHAAGATHEARRAWRAALETLGDVYPATAAEIREKLAALTHRADRVDGSGRDV
jgi:tetratricopeptide (TPR) repeat protein/transcriptional regulator with XRE-family HTH domain